MMRFRGLKLVPCLSLSVVKQTQTQASADHFIHLPNLMVNFNAARLTWSTLVHIYLTFPYFSQLICTSHAGLKDGLRVLYIPVPTLPPHPFRSVLLLF